MKIKILSALLAIIFAAQITFAAPFNANAKTKRLYQSKNNGRNQVN